MSKETIKILFILISTILLSTIFCGCNSTEVENNKTDVDFESDVVNLLECNIEFTESRENIIVQAIVAGKIENKLDRILDVEIVSEFYDKDNSYLGQQKFTIIGLREKDNPGYATTFTITYNEKNSNMIDHIKLTAIEI